MAPISLLLGSSEALGIPDDFSSSPLFDFFRNPILFARSFPVVFWRFFLSGEDLDGHHLFFFFHYLRFLLLPDSFR